MRKGKSYWSSQYKSHVLALNEFREKGKHLDSYEVIESLLVGAVDYLATKVGDV